jgi:hypothetical protein
MKAIALVRNAGNGLSLGALIESIPLSCPLALPAVLSMLANGYLQMDISHGLDLDLYVSLGPSALLGESRPESSATHPVLFQAANRQE